MTASRHDGGGRFRFWILAALGAAAVAAAQPLQPEHGAGQTGKPLVEGRQFMVAAAHPLAVDAGYRVLDRGGSAMDAAVAVQATLNLVEPQSSGIGGGAFLLYWDAASGELHALDGRETAPAAAGPDYFLGDDGEPRPWWDVVVGGRSVGVPGVLRLLEAGHGRFGRLSWDSLFEDAIALAEDGFDVTARLSASIADAVAHGLGRFEPTRDYFLHDDGTGLAAGERLSNPALAATFRQIAHDGADALYRGDLAGRIVAAVRNHGDVAGVMTVRDLHVYRAVWRRPVCLDYRAWRVCGMGPPSSGALTIGQILGLLEHFDLTAIGAGAQADHLFLEAARLAYADRALYMADSDFVDVPVAGLLDPAYLTHRAQRIDRDRAMAEAPPGNPPWRQSLVLAPDLSAERPGTTHFSIVDSFGNVVSMTSSIETGFGSRLMVGGFLLNNQLTDFSFEGASNGRPIANRIEAGKRPRSSMAPTIVFDRAGRPVLAVGSPGGSRIINYVARTLVAYLDFGMDIKAAIDRPHVTTTGSGVDIEPGPGAEALAADLAARGHQVSVRDLNSGLHGISIAPDGILAGAADPRREGAARGR